MKIHNNQTFYTYNLDDDLIHYKLSSLAYRNYSCPNVVGCFGGYYIHKLNSRDLYFAHIYHPAYKRLLEQFNIKFDNIEAIVEKNNLKVPIGGKMGSYYFLDEENPKYVLDFPLIYFKFNDEYSQFSKHYIRYIFLVMFRLLAITEHKFEIDEELPEDIFNFLLEYNNRNKQAYRGISYNHIEENNLLVFDNPETCNYFSKKLKLIHPALIGLLSNRQTGIIEILNWKYPQRLYNIKSEKGYLCEGGFNKLTSGYFYKTGLDELFNDEEKVIIKGEEYAKHIVNFIKERFGRSTYYGKLPDNIEVQEVK